MSRLRNSTILKIHNIQLLLLSCADINECAEDGELCRAGFCRNVPGSWECECREGWQLTPDLRDCADTRTGACFDQYRGGGKSRYIDRLCIHKTSCCNTQSVWIQISCIFVFKNIFTSFRKYLKISID